jgi:hypothetical protein
VEAEEYACMNGKRVSVHALKMFRDAETMRQNNRLIDADTTVKEAMDILKSRYYGSESSTLIHIASTHL